MPVVYTNAIIGESNRFALESLPRGVAQVSPGKFYFTCHPLAYFYCDTIRENMIQWQLVETFQNSELIQALSVKQGIKYSTFYIPVTDKQILIRLQARLDKLRER